MPGLCGSRPQESTQPTLQVPREYFSLYHLWWDCGTCHHLQMGFPGHLPCITMSGQDGLSEKVHPGKCPKARTREVSSNWSISSKQGEIICSWPVVIIQCEQKREIFRIADNHALSSIYTKPVSWASLVAQWLRICLPMQGTRVRALVCEDPTCRGATRPVRHNYWACTSGACAPQQERLR